MIQTESLRPACACPGCGYRCEACMGTDSVIPKGRFAGLAWALLDDDAVDSEEADGHLTGALRPEEFID